MKKNNLFDFKSDFILVIVTSFVTAAVIGFFAGALGYDLRKEGIKLVTQKESLSEEEASSLKYAAGETSPVKSTEEQIVSVVEKVSPAVVSIIITKDLPVLEEYYQEYNPFGDDEFLRRFFGDDFFSFKIPRYRQKGTEKKEIGGGTGFIISSDGLILTNKHVVADEKAEYTVLLNEGEKVSAQVLARDPVQDIALLKIDKTNLPTVKLGDSDKLKIGQTVIAIGNALGEFRNTVSVGVISGLRRSITAGNQFGQSEYLPEVIQTDAAINQGNSGGPLLNLRGEAIGINVAMAQGAENIGFALPINRVKRDIQQVKKEGRITYPFLGVRYLIITPQIQQKNQLPVSYGALVVRGNQPDEVAVVPGGPADKAGIVENDIILEVNGEKVTSENTLSELIQKHQIGEKVVLKVLHKGEEKNIEVELGER